MDCQTKTKDASGNIQRARLLCLGDSLTDCGRLLEHPPLGNGYVSILSEKLAAHGQDWHITNLGFDGFTVSRLLDKISGSPAPEADVITLLIGINDIGLMMNTGRTEEQKNEMMAAYFSRFRRLLRLLEASDRRILLMEPFVFPRPEEYRLWIPYVQAMSQGLQTLAADFGLSFLPLHHRLNEEALRNGTERVTGDGIHLTRAGHELLASLLFHILTSSGQLFCYRCTRKRNLP